MKILLVGSGGREHALAWKLGKSPKVEKIYVAPGNGGTANENKCENIELTKICDLLNFAKNNNIDLTVVGPEEPLINGIVDAFKGEGLKIFGPDKAGAMLEGSKSFSKDFMKKYGVKTACYEVFYDYEEAKSYLENCKYPRVIKADGLAAGKGVVICGNKDEAIETLDLFMIDDVFKGAGKKIVVEEFLQGVEASILSVTDGKVILPFLSAKDHKQIFDGNKGKNTGGMGVVSPNKYVSEEVLADFYENILDKTLIGIREEGFDFKGVIFFGIMITEEGAKLLEYNVRMGDPETQSVLSLMESDLVDIILNALDEKLNETTVKWNEGYCVNVVLASKGYPEAYEKGYEISIDESLKEEYFIAGAKKEGDSLVTSGGRVLSVVGKGKTLEEAKENAYKNIEKVNFEGMYFRKDIGTAK
ncbi:phosphoribosylamine--glycine ligase [Clostridium perfringens]|uniref:phosphoribosylamine--glycine ligase n=1 Tax=Clostridium perfringens TaxID=1502 RepID=UPI00210D4FD4|nr:phosphoribosylamine--glycine ligase [Clostridium perfringens]